MHIANVDQLFSGRKFDTNFGLRLNKNQPGQSQPFRHTDMKTQTTALAICLNGYSREQSEFPRLH